MQENYLAKWLNNELTEAERTAFEESDEFASYQRIVNAADKLQAPDFEMEQAMKAVQNKRILGETKLVQLHPFKRFMKVAAVAAVLIAGAYFYVNSLDETIATQFAENTEVQLPDDSKVILNADSKIVFSNQNWNDERKVTLDGEAFFKVAKGKTFSVHTANGIVTVLGTEFNVEHRGDFFEVSCFEGLVSVTHNGKELKLPAGSSYVSLANERIETPIQKNGVPSWINKESTFKSIPLDYVFEELSRQHNITVEVAGIDTKQLFTGTFSNSNLELALKSISIPSRIKFKFEGKKVLFYAENNP